MKKIFALLFASIFVAGSLFAEDTVAKDFSEDLLFMEVPIVVTASKRAETIVKAPSVMYVITEKEIKMSGARTLADILKRVPGMRISVRESSLLGSRGFTSDQNDKFVFLIDGVQIKNTMQDGVYNMLDMPDMSMIKKIEIAKGPGSTLWGSDATLGIIHVFTKDGADLQGIKTTFEMSSNDNMMVGNVMYGNKTNDGDYMVSFTYTQSDGFSEHGNGGNDFYWWGNEDDEDVPNPYVASPNSSSADVADYIRLLDISPSFELYGKVKIGDFILKSRASLMANDYLWQSVNGIKKLDARMKNLYTEAEHLVNISDDSNLTTKLHAHGMLYERGVPNYDLSTDVATDIETLTEMGTGVEAIYQTKIADNNHLILGAKYNIVQIGPDLRFSFLADSGETTTNVDAPTGFKYPIVVKPGIDNTAAAYIEDSLDIGDMVTLVGGVSVEYNDLREMSTQIMPRGALIVQAMKELAVKYSYNTGYQRPPASKKFSRHFGYVTKSEKIQEHDAQLMLNLDQFRAVVTGFHYRIADYFTWFDEGVIDPITGLQRAGHFNKGQAESSGVEVMLQGYIGKALSLYGNYSFANTLINFGYAVGEPQHVYNLGLDWYILENLSANVNVNGFAQMFRGTDSEGENMWWDGLTEQVVDLTVVADNLFDDYSLTVYANNLLNNKVHAGMTGWPGYTYAKGLSIGVKVSAHY